MAPKDFVNIDRNYFYSHLIQMDDEIDLKSIQRASSVDSLEQTDLISTTSENLRFINGYHNWINTNDKIRVEKIIDNHHQFDYDDDDSIQQKTLSSNDTGINQKLKFESEEEEDNEENSLSHMDISLNHYDVQLQVNNGEPQQAIRYGVFSSLLSKISQIEKIHLFKTNQSSQTIEMDMENGDSSNGKRNGYSQHHNNDGSYRRSRLSNGSSDNNSGGGAGNGSNPNRNNNNSRRSNDDGSEGNDNEDDGDDDDDDSDDNNDETDESVARRLGLSPVDNETILIIGRLRNLTNKRSFDRRDFETLQLLVDELIHVQHLENFSKEQLKKCIRYLKLYRPLRTKSRALIFLQERIPRRAVKYNVISSNNEIHSNVFNIWRERERRARLDSKDSLEDEGQNQSGQQLRDVTEINHPTPPILVSHSNVTSKVKQMAKDIDTRSTSSRSEINIRTGDRFSDYAYIPRSSSPTYPGLISVALYDIKSPNNNIGSHTEIPLPNKQNISSTSSISPTPSEPNHVKQLIDRLEPSSSSSITKATKTISTKKSFHEDHSDGSTSKTSSPPIKRVARRDSYDKILTNGNHSNNGGGFVIPHNDSQDDVFFPTDNPSNTKRFELDREERTNRCRRTASGTTTEEYISTLLPGSETSVTRVRDIRAHVYEDHTAVSRIDLDSVPVKVDVETLYILEQTSDKRSSQPSIMNIFIPDYEYNRSSTTERKDSSIQTITPTSTIKPAHRPMGTQVDSTVEQHNVAAQTSESLHRPPKERPRLPSSPIQDGETNKTTTTTTVTTTRYEIKRRRSSHRSSEDEDDGAAVIYIDNKSKKHGYEENFELKPEKRHSSTDDHLPVVPAQRPPFGQITSRIRIEQLRDLNRHVARRHEQKNSLNEEEHRSSEIYEIHTRGACKCLVVSYEEKTQSGSQTRFEKQLDRIEHTYADEELKATELHVIVTSSDGDYQLVKRDYGLNKQDDDDEKENENINNKSRQPTISIHYYTKEGHRMRTEHARRLEHLPLVIRCEIEYELNHYGSARLIILSVTKNERHQMNTSLKNELVEEIVSHSGGRLSAKSPELEHEITRQLAEPTSLLHLVDYSSRDDYNQTNSTDLRRVSRIDVTTSLRLVQRYRTIIHRLCQLHRSHIRLTHQAEQQRHLILISCDDYYLLDLTSHTSSISTNISDIRQRQHDIFKREVNNVTQQPFDFAKYRRDAEQQQRILEQRYQQKKIEQKQPSQRIHTVPPPSGHPSEAEFYLGSERRALIEREIHSMRESIRPHEHAPPRYKHEPKRRSLSISYAGGQRYVRARIIHIKDFFDETQQQQRQAKEQELFVRVDDYVNEAAANCLRRSYSTDYLNEDGPRSRIRFIRIPGETIKIEEKTTYEYQGVMYADLPYSLRYWNILYILNREARQGRPLGSTLPQVIVNDPYQQVIPPLTQHEIRQTAQQILSPQYNARSHTDQTLRWFLSRDNRTEIESTKYLQTLDQYRAQQQQQHQQSNISVRGGGQEGASNKYFVTEKLVHYEKLPDRLVPLSVNNRAQSNENISHRSPSIPRILQPPYLPQNHIQRSQSQPRPYYQQFTSSPHVPVFQTPPQQQQHRAQLPPMHSPLSRHQSVHELHAPSALSRPPSPSPSLHSLHSNHHYHHQQQQQQHRRPVAFNNRFSSRPPSQQQNLLLTEIIDSQTGRRILTTSQEQLPTEVLGLLNKYNLQHA